MAELAETYAQAAAALTAVVPPSRQGFWRSHTLLQASTWFRIVAAGSNVSACAVATAAGDSAGASAAARAAEAHISALVAEQRASEGPGWEGFHLYDWLDGFANLRDTMRRLVARVEKRNGTGTAAVPPLRPWRFGTGEWNSFFNYDKTPVRQNNENGAPTTPNAMYHDAV